MKKRDTISIYPDAELKEKLERLSEKYRRSVNQQVLVMLDDWLTIYGNKSETESNKNGEGSVKSRASLPSFGGKKSGASRVKKNRISDLVIA